MNRQQKLDEFARSLGYPGKNAFSAYATALLNGTACCPHCKAALNPNPVNRAKLPSPRIPVALGEEHQQILARAAENGGRLSARDAQRLKAKPLPSTTVKQIFSEIQAAGLGKIEQGIRGKIVLKLTPGKSLLVGGGSRQEGD